MPVDKVLLVRGEVQGVTYRDYVKAKASRHNITGYVENLPGGTVEIGCHGEDIKVNSFIADIKSDIGKDKLKGCFGRVVSVEDSDKPVNLSESEHSSFVVRVGEANYEIREGFASAVKFLGDTNKRVDNGFERTDNNFDVLGEKYHNISRVLYLIVFILISMLIVLIFGLGVV